MFMSLRHSRLSINTKIFIETCKNALYFAIIRIFLRLSSTHIFYIDKLINFWLSQFHVMFIYFTFIPIQWINMCAIRVKLIIHQTFFRLPGGYFWDFLVFFLYVLALNSRATIENHHKSSAKYICAESCTDCGLVFAVIT